MTKVLLGVSRRVRSADDHRDAKLRSALCERDDPWTGQEIRVQAQKPRARLAERVQEFFRRGKRGIEDGDRSARLLEVRREIQKPERRIRPHDFLLDRIPGEEVT